MDRHAVSAELERVRVQFRQLIESMTAEDLDRPSTGTRWTNRELLFHLLFGYIVVRNLLWLVRFFGHLPAPVSRAFAATLNAGTRPFNTVNYLGSYFGARVYRPARMAGHMDRITVKLARRLARETERGLARGMHYPTGWDPFFADYMTVANIYRFPTQHFDFHARQLNLAPRATGAGNPAAPPPP